MWKQEIECPKCEHEFMATEFEEGACPNCGNTYGWDSQIVEQENGPEEVIWPDWKEWS